MVDLERPGTYVLVMRLQADVVIRVGALGELPFAEGWYLYVGSAMGGLGHRLRRHARSNKRLHWHIDYVRAHADLVEAWVYVGTERVECPWAQHLCQAPAIEPFAAPLGASDCTGKTHLFHSSKRPSVDWLARCCFGDMLEVVDVFDLRASHPEASSR